VSQHLALLQETVAILYESQERHLEVVGPDLRILADASPEHIGTIVDNPTGEVAATLKDGETRIFVEISPDHPQGIRHVVVRAKDEETGKIAGAIILDYTPLYEAIQQTQTAAVRTLILLAWRGLH